MPLSDALLLESAPFDVWISYRLDGVRGSGTASDPWDGHTQALFDACLNGIATKNPVTRIHLGPSPRDSNGVVLPYLTKGYADDGSGGWQAKAGMRIVGSGMEATMLKLDAPSSAAHHFAVGHSLGNATIADTFEISDLTIDCNLAGAGSSAACGAIRVMGDHVRICRVKAINWGTKFSSRPCYVFSLITGSPDNVVPEAVNAGIENCVAITPGVGNNGVVTVFNVGSQDDLSFTRESHAKSPFVRDCFADCGQATPDPINGKYRGISMGWCRGGVVEGNQIHNADIAGPYQDLRSVRDLIVRNNVFKNVGKGIVLKQAALGSTFLTGTAKFSIVSGIATIYGNDAGGAGLNLTSLVVGDRVKLALANSIYNGVYEVKSIQMTSFTAITPLTLGSPITVNSAIKLLSVSRAIIDANVIELPLGVVGISAVSIDDNNDITPYVETPDYVHGDILVRHNKIRAVDSSGPLAADTLLVQVKGAKNLHATNNVLDVASGTAINTSRCGSITCFDNRNADALSMPPPTAATDRYLTDLDLPAEDSFLMAYFAKS